MKLLIILLQATSFFLVGETTPPPPIEGPDVFVSQDQGESWSDFTRGIEKGQTANDIFELGDRLFLTTKPGQLYWMHRDDEDRCWQRITEGLPETMWIKTLARNGNRMILGTFHNGIYLSDDRGESWHRPANNIDSRILAFHYTGNRLLAATDQGILQSHDHGLTWKLRENIYGVTDFVVFNGQLVVVQQSRMGILREDGLELGSGVTFTPVRELFPHEDYLYFRTLDGKMYRTSDVLNWEEAQQEYVRSANGPLPEALFYGYESDLQQSNFEKNLLRSTSLGWISIRRSGC